MNKQRTNDLAAQYRAALIDDVIPFWEQYSIDRECGGYFSCLDRDGSVFDTDKFVWLQARQVWMFSSLCNRRSPSFGERVGVKMARDAWLDVAQHGAIFLAKHGRDMQGNWYFSLTRDGTPLVQPYNIFSDCFAAMAFSQFALAKDDDEARNIAQTTFDNILARKANPRGVYDKGVPGTRPLIGLSLPMILSHVALDLEWMLSAEQIDETLDTCIHDLFALFLDEANGVMREAVAPDGTKLDCFDSRLVAPGHTIEAMWFMVDIGERRGDTKLIERATSIVLSTLDFGWDKEYGGIFYFRDAEGRPPDRLDWDQKLWWVHLETLVALLKGYRLTGDKACWDWFEKVHAYAWSHFPDPEHGEWYGYLNRRGEVLLPLKGGKWKGCFHVPRALDLCATELERCTHYAKLQGS